MRLHEREAHVRPQLAHNLIDIAAYGGREVGVNHRGIAARDEFHQPADVMAGGDLSEADSARQCFGALLVLWIAIPVHEIDRCDAEAIIIGRLQSRSDVGFIEWSQHCAVSGDALVDFDHTLIEWRWQHNGAGEQLRSVLVPDAKRIGEAGSGDEKRAVAFAFE